jgi:flagellar hook-associated protein 3 FlgL
MQVSGYPDLLSFTRRNRITTQLREQLNVVSEEAVTGLKSDITTATNGRTGEAHLLQKAVNDLDLSRQLNSLSQTRVALTTNSIVGAREAMNDIGTRSVIALNTNSQIGVDIIREEAKSSLQSAITSLNTRQGSRNLFSGAHTDRPPFAAGAAEQILSDVGNILAGAASTIDAEAQLDDYFNDPNGRFSTDIYQGSTTDAANLPVGNGSTLNLGVRADNSVFRDLLQGLSMLANADQINVVSEPEAFNDIYSAGAKLASSANDGLINLEAQLGILSETLGKGEKRFANEATVLGEAFNAMFGRDQFEAAAELQALQVQLEASYTVTARLADLSLTNYLR